MFDYAILCLQDWCLQSLLDCASRSVRCRSVVAGLRRDVVDVPLCSVPPKHWFVPVYTDAHWGGTLLRVSTGDILAACCITNYYNSQASQLVRNTV